MFFQNINYLNVVLATLGSLIIGIIWYSPWVFGKNWMKCKQLLSILVSSLLTSFVLATILNSLIVAGLWSTICFGFLIWLGFIVSVKTIDYFFNKETTASYWIFVCYELIAILVMSIIINLL